MDHNWKPECALRINNSDEKIFIFAAAFSIRTRQSISSESARHIYRKRKKNESKKCHLHKQADRYTLSHDCLRRVSWIGIFAAS